MGKRRIKGFEDYDFQYVSDSVFKNNLSEWCMSCYFPWDCHKLWLDIPEVLNNYPGDNVYADDIIEEREDLLGTAKTVHILPSCKIPRNLVTAKYKKVLNPWMADMIIAPHDSIRKGYYTNIVFFSEIMKTIFVVYTNFTEILDRFKGAEKGKKFKDFLAISEDNWINLLNSNSSSKVELWKAIFDSEFEFIGNAAHVEPSNEWIIDVIEGTLPKDKIVFEKTALAYLGNNDNQPTVENLLNIREMLNSKDEATNSVGLKALAMLDYIHYPNSVQLILQYANSSYGQWKYCQASNASSVKFMFKQLFGGTARHYYLYRNDIISQEDYDLFTQLLKAVTEDNNEYARTLANMSFMYMDGSMSIHPRIGNPQ